MTKSTVEPTKSGLRNEQIVLKYEWSKGIYLGGNAIEKLPYSFHGSSKTRLVVTSEEAC